MSIVVPTILSEGKALDSIVQILSIDIAREVNRIPYARLVIQDGNIAAQDFPVSNLTTFEPGRQIEIRLRYEGDSSSERTVFQGFVVRHRIDAQSSGTRLTVDLKDRCFVMTRFRRSVIYHNEKDSSIFAKLIGSHADLKKGEITPTEFEHEAMVQMECTDWDFLLLRAQALGLFVWVQDGTISVTALPDSGRPEHPLTLGLDEIFALNLELDAAAQMEQFEARAWDIKQQKLSSPQRSQNFELDQGNFRGSAAARAISKDRETLLSSQPMQMAELKRRASALLIQSRLSYIRGVVTTTGFASPRLLDTLNLSGVGRRFGGKNWITGIRHRVSSEGWQTDLQVGLPVDGIAESEDVLAPPASGLLAASRGLLIGLVEEVGSDPGGEFRLKVLLPTIEESVNHVWARLAAPYAGNQRGQIFRPEPGDEVVIGFLNEDPRFPVILGALFGSKNKPPEAITPDDENNEEKVIVSRTGLKLTFRDSDKPALLLETPAGNALRLDDEDEHLQITDQHGNSILLSSQGVEVSSAKDLKLDAGGNVEITGTKVDIK